VIETAGRTLSIAPGAQTLVTRDSVKSFEQVNPAEAITYRNMTSSSLGQGLKTFTSEFSIPQAIYIVRALKNLVNSKVADAQSLTSHLFKTTSIILQMHGAS